VHNTLSYRRNATPEMRERFAGVMQTIWSDSGDYLDQYYGRKEPDIERGDPLACSKAFLAEMRNLKP
jgi:hypothetical protein